ncbi:MAG: chemotaxis protein CheA, partial [Spirochaetota bacterium]
AADGVVEKGRGKQSGGGSVLRVDSRRVDSLLNLVSETVINKAAFNQLATGFNEELSSLQTADERYRELIRRLFDSLPEYLERIRDGVSPTAVKREIASEFGELYSVFDDFQSSFKGSVSRLRSTTQNLGRITGELQEAVMHIRMVPISQIFSRFPRLVRDLSRSLNKQVNLEIVGEDTELDKSVIDDLLDPLIHSARNSIDHGIEASAERVAAGKPEAGTLRLAASNEGNMIVITVEDDGRGIDVESIQRKAVERGIIPAGKTLSDVEAHNLIFDPGFSTAREITNVSGRGVGLDVVKRQIEKVNGTVAVWSEKGAGTRFTIKIPLTLAIIQGLLVRVGTERYAIPITSVIESHRIRPSEIRLLDNYEVFNVREDVVSLIRLNRLFGIEADGEREYYFVVIVGTGEKRIGLLVDSLIGEEDVVIKPLRDHYTNAPGIAGANITGDGTVSLIIDVSQLLDLGMRHEMERRRRRETRIS